MATTIRPLRRGDRAQARRLALGRHPDAVSVGLLAMLSCVVFWQSLSGRLVVVGYDLSLYAYPYRARAPGGDSISIGMPPTRA